ncbi:hypothetical protein BBK36DRAFT_1105597, partial [Trichoderma citrinoviride]
MRPNPKHLIDFFARSLTSFQSSPDVFRILCTLPHINQEPGPRRPAAAPPPPSSSRVKRLVVLDSSFNPPTRAHAEMARSALKWAAAAASSAPLEKNEDDDDGRGSVRLLLLLSVNNADKAPKPASFPLRLGMMDGFGHELLRSLDGLEEEGGDGEGRGVLRRPEIDLAVTKMPYFHEKARVIGESGVYSSSSSSSSSKRHEPEQVFLAGFDTVIRIFNPKYYGEGEGGMKAALGPFFDRARLRVTMRTDDEWGEEDEQRAYVRGLGEGALDELGGDAAWAGRVDLVEG